MRGVDPAVRRRHKLRNAAQAGLLLAGMATMLGTVAWLLFGGIGIVWVLVMAAVALFLQPTVPTGWVRRMYGAAPLPQAAAPQVHTWMHTLARRAGLTTVPRLYYIASPMMNAMALGSRDDPVLCLTDGVLRRLTGRELVGVMAHEIAHIRANDLWIMNLSDIAARLAHGLAYAAILGIFLAVPSAAGGTWTPMLIALLVAALPTVTTLLQLALSRSREYDADLEAAALTDDPAGLASALQRLEHQEGRTWERIAVPHRPGTDPLLFSTHPPTDERIRRLRSLAPQTAQPRLGGQQPVAIAHRPPSHDRTRVRAPGIWW